MMHSMMMTHGFGSPLFGLLQMICCALCLAGFVLLLIWAAKTLTHRQLQTWGAGLLVAGIAICAVVCIATGGGMYGKSSVSCTDKDGVCTMQNGGMMDGSHMMPNGQMMMNGMMGGSHMMQNGQMMMNDDMGGMMMHDSSMTMDDMVNMLKGKTGDAFDKAFLEGMIPHHQGAVDMANAVLRDAKHDELKQLARDIIASQQKEIDMMKQWQKDWGYTQ